MRRDNINYFAVGLFVVAMGVTLLVVLYKITGRVGPTDRYYVHYSNVSGIKYGTGVFFEGYQIGQVEAIEPDRGADGLRYRIEFSVQKGWPIPADSVAKIVASGLLAAVSIDIAEGTSEVMLEPGSEVAGQDQVNLFAAINNVATYFKDLSESDIRPLLQNLNARITELAVEYTDLSRSTIRPLLTTVRDTLGDKELMQRLRSAVARLDDSARRLQTLLRDENQERLSAILANVQEASAGLERLIERFETTRGRMDAVLEDVDALVAGSGESLEASVADLRRSMRAIAANIDTIMYHVEGSARNMHEFTRQIRENPALLIGGSAQPEGGQE